MRKRLSPGKLNEAIDLMLAHSEQGEFMPDADLLPFIEIASTLARAPRKAFRQRLKLDLLRTAAQAPAGLQQQVRRSSVAPVLQVRGAGDFIDFLKRAFFAGEEFVHRAPDGTVAHAEMRIGDMMLELGEAHGQFEPRPGGFHLLVPNSDAIYERALQSGAVSLYEPRDMPYGDHEGGVVDPFGNHWYIGTRKEQPVAGEIAVSSRAAARAGFHTVTPYLIVRYPAELLDFVKEAFGAQETLRTMGSAGGMHAEARIGDSMIMIGGAPEMTRPEMTAVIYLYVTDVDAMYERAIRAGAVSQTPPQDQPYGDRMAHVVDPYGNTWFIATHRE